MKMKKNYNVWIITLFLLFIAKSNNAQIKLPPDFVHEKIAPIFLPTCLAVGPDGRIFVGSSEPSTGQGKIYVIKNGQMLTEPFITINQVMAKEEKGLIGIAFDPDFAINKYVYIHYTFDIEGKNLDNDDIRNKIVRVTANGDKAVDGSMIDILNLDIIPGWITTPNHDGGTILFGPDKKLYIAVGENNLYCPKECITSTGCNWGSCSSTINWSQDMDVYHGKLLRINSDGSAPTDNPFYAAGASEQKKRIFALGFRNPYTFHLRKSTGDLYINDVGSAGTKRKEEINKLTLDKSSTGKNFGYPKVEGKVNNPAYVDPIFVYSGTGSDTLSGCAIAGGFFYEPTLPAFPSKYVGKYFFIDFCNGWINYINEDGTGLRNFATGLAGGGSGFGSCSIEIGADGQIYHLVRSSGATWESGLYRIRYTGTSIGTKDAYENKYAFSVHPNPAKDLLNIHLTGIINEEGSLIVSDGMAKERLKYNLNITPGFFDQNFDISSLEKGVYFVKLQTKNSSVTKKLVVE